VVDQACRDLHDMAAGLIFHLRDGALRDVEEAGNVHVQHGRVIGVGILRERLGDEDAGVVDKRVDAPEPPHPFRDHPIRRLPIADIAGNDQDVGVDGLAERAVATTR
jgi:hypothetical protein